MDAREKIAAAVEYLKARGVPARSAAPPLFKLLWRIGVHIPPPHFIGFLPLALLFGLPFGILLAAALGIAGSVMGWKLDPWQLAQAIPTGAAFGIAMAAAQKFGQRHLDLPSWSVFDPTASDGDEPW